MDYVHRWWFGLLATKLLAEQERWSRSERMLMDNMVPLIHRGEAEDLRCVAEAKKILERIVRPHLAH